MAPLSPSDTMQRDSEVVNDKVGKIAHGSEVVFATRRSCMTSVPVATTVLRWGERRRVRSVVNRVGQRKFSTSPIELWSMM
jgi:hypothetical protein